MEYQAFLQDLPWLLFIAVMIAVVVFPIVFLVSFFYEGLEKKFEKTPKILLMFACTVIGCVIAVLLAYLYIGYTLQRILAA